MAVPQGVSTSYADSTLSLLADVVDDFAAPDAARARTLRDGGGTLDREMWRRFAENGWIGIAVPQESGGAGLGIEAVTIVARRLGYSAFPEPFVAAGVLAPQLLAESDSPLAGELLSRAIEGDEVHAVAWQGDRGGMDEGGVEVSLTPSGLEGRARFVGLADADLYLVAARERDGVSINLVGAEAKGLQALPERRADGTLDVRLSFGGVAPEAQIVDALHGAQALMGCVEAARVALCAELVGLIGRVLEITLAYMRERRQFGKPIGAQQALQHRIVDAWIQGQLAAAALQAATSIHEDPDRDAAARAAAASSAKARAAQAARDVCNQALQLHGAIGFTDEYELGVYINRALALSPFLGTAAEHRRRYAALEDLTGSRA